MVAWVIIVCTIVAGVWVLRRQRRRASQAVGSLDHRDTSAACDDSLLQAGLSPVPSTSGVICSADQNDRYALIVRLAMLVAGNGLDSRQSSLRHDGRFSTRGEAQFTLWHSPGMCVIVRTTRHGRSDDSAQRFVVCDDSSVPRVLSIELSRSDALLQTRSTTLDGMAETALAQLQLLVSELGQAYLVGPFQN